MPVWIDTHCHLDAAEFAADRSAMRARAAAAGVALCVLPAVGVFNFAAVRELAHQFGDACLQSRGDAFVTLARSIVGQQISVKAADAVWSRVVCCFSPAGMVQAYRTPPR